jgi:16S rRNA (adenine1518-N6/adenine1519-N6)-dimethyltransferase
VNLYELISDEEKIKLAGNLPYNVASLMIIDCAFKLDILEFCVFMIQKEVAEKLIAKPKTKDYTFLSVFIQTFFDVKYIMSVPARFFNPPPKVTSAVVKLTPKQNIAINNVKKYKNFISHLFQNRRKMIKSKIEEEMLNKAGISPNLRAEELSVEDFIRIFEVVENDDR